MDDLFDQEFGHPKTCSTRNFDLNLVCPNTQGKPREGEPLRTEKLRG